MGFPVERTLHHCLKIQVFTLEDGPDNPPVSSAPVLRDLRLCARSHPEGSVCRFRKRTHVQNKQ